MNRLGTLSNPIAGVSAGTSVYFSSVALPNGEELQIVTRQPIPMAVLDDIWAREILAAQIYPRRLDANV
jgi:hypothetical protein